MGHKPPLWTGSRTRSQAARADAARSDDGYRWMPSKSGVLPLVSSRSHLSPANFETWLKDTALVAVDDTLFRVAVPSGFAKDWLESRYRSLISQTLARVVGYSVTLEFEVREVAPSERADSDEEPETAEAAPASPPRHRPRRGSGWSPAASADPRAARSASTRATPSGPSSSAPPIASRMPRACRSRSAPDTPTTRCSCTAGSASARRT